MSKKTIKYIIIEKFRKDVKLEDIITKILEQAVRSSNKSITEAFNGKANNFK